jgi:hypothetical protein
VKLEQETFLMAVGRVITELTRPLKNHAYKVNVKKE